jgi:IS5 family transposase
VQQLLADRRLLLKSGTIMDATVIAAPSSTKNAAAQRDPEMRQGRQGPTWHFGMKFHIGTDRRGLVHHVTATHAGAADITQVDVLLHGDEREVFGDQAYWSEAHRQAFRARGTRYRVNRRGHHHRPLTPHQRDINRRRSRHRARGEHPFHVVKRLWGTKVRYRGLAKNLTRGFAMFALANLYMVRYRLGATRATCRS